MLDKIIILAGFGVIILFILGPWSRLIDLHRKRTYQEMWRKVQEEAKTKGIVVGKWKEMLERSNS